MCYYSSMENIIEVKNLRKKYGNVVAVNDLSFCVKKGELFAFLGVNGAGKSTTISIISGQLNRDCGDVAIAGYAIDDNLDSIKSRLGVVFQHSVLDKSLTVKDNLLSRAALYGIGKKHCLQRIEELDSMLHILPLMKRTVGKLSGGQRRRIDIARALIHKPNILILDEPTTGLDPQTRKDVWAVVEKLQKEQKMTVFLTTHYMEEAAGADYVVIIDEGSIAAQGTPLELKNTYTGDCITMYGVKEEDINLLKKPYIMDGDCCRIQVKNSLEATEIIAKNAELFTDYEVSKGKMDDVFLAVTGKRGEGL